MNPVQGPRTTLNSTVNQSASLLDLFYIRCSLILCREAKVISSSIVLAIPVNFCLQRIQWFWVRRRLQQSTSVSMCTPTALTNNRVIEYAYQHQATIRFGHTRPGIAVRLRRLNNERKSEQERLNTTQVQGVRRRRRPRHIQAR